METPTKFKLILANSNNTVITNKKQKQFDAIKIYQCLNLKFI